MKQLLTIVAILTLCGGCKKQATTTPAPTNSSSHTTNTTLNTIALTEAAMVGHWVFDSIVSYNNGSIVKVVKSSPNNWGTDYVFDTFSTYFSGSGSPKKNLSYGEIGQPESASFWFVNDIAWAMYGRMQLATAGQTYFGGYIINLNSSNLVTTITGSYGTVLQGDYNFFHK